MDPLTGIATTANSAPTAHYNDDDVDALDARFESLTIGSPAAAFVQQFGTVMHLISMTLDDFVNASTIVLPVDTLNAMRLTAQPKVVIIDYFHILYNLSDLIFSSSRIYPKLTP